MDQLEGSVSSHDAYSQPKTMHTAHKCFTTRLMDALFFSDAVYEQSLRSVVQNLGKKIGRIEPLLDFGFDRDGHEQVVLLARSLARCGREHVVVACRGTSGVKDFLQDLKYFPTRLPFAEGAAHWGFMERAQSIPIDRICEVLASGEDVTFTGHSLGGAVASLLCLRVLESTNGIYEKQVQCITFGSPLFANCHLAEFINHKYKDSFIHIISQQDFVPRVISLVSIVQKLLYTSENHLRGLWILAKALECMSWLPIGALIRSLERNIPAVLKFILKCIAKLMLCSEAVGTFAFAGHVLMLNHSCPEDTKCSLTLACPDELNMWYSQVNFGFGVRLTPSMLDHHGMPNYYQGIVLALSQELKLKGSILQDKPHEVEVHQELYGSSITLFGTLADYSKPAHDNIVVPQRSSSMTLMGHREEAGGGDGEEAFLSSRECVLVSTKLGDFEVAIQKEGSIHVNEMPDEKKAVLEDPVVGSSLTQAPSGCCAGVVGLFLPFSWEKISGGAHLQEARVITSTAALLGARRSYKARSKRDNLQRFNSWSHTAGNSAEAASESDEIKRVCKGKKGFPSLPTAICEMRNALVMRNSSRSPPRKSLRIGWLIGSIGRVARHVQALDNLCILTIIGIFISNLHG